jgi:hypothetical protein
MPIIYLHREEESILLFREPPFVSEVGCYYLIKVRLFNKVKRRLNFLDAIGPIRGLSPLVPLFSYLRILRESFCLLVPHNFISSQSTLPYLLRFECSCIEGGSLQLLDDPLRSRANQGHPLVFVVFLFIWRAIFLC